MKKWIALLLAGAMLLALCACGNSGAPEEPTTAPDIVVEPEPEPTPEPEPVEPEPEPEPEPAAPEFTNPLTGEAVESDISMKRPIAVMMNSLKKALPQSGCGSADLLIEITEEGGITRVMGVFQDPTGVGDLGTIRSVREYFAFIAMGYDAVLCHCGGSNFGMDALARHNYPTLNEMSHGNLYWRDAYRKQNVGYEHSLYTSSDNVQNYLAQTDKIRSDHEDGYACPLVFTENGTPASGESAAQIDVSFSGYKDTHFTYDEAAGKYKVVFFDDLPYVDANTDQQVAVTNVIVVVTKQSSKPDGEHQEYDLSSGSGYFACGGQYVPIHWSKGGEMDPLTFTNTDGSPLELGVGNSYICVVDDDRPLSFQ